MIEKDYRFRIQRDIMNIHILEIASEFFSHRGNYPDRRILNIYTKEQFDNFRKTGHNFIWEPKELDGRYHIKFPSERLVTIDSIQMALDSIAKQENPDAIGLITYDIDKNIKNGDYLIFDGVIFLQAIPEIFTARVECLCEEESIIHNGWHKQIENASFVNPYSYN
jgi:hypothetical protein